VLIEALVDLRLVAPFQTIHGTVRLGRRPGCGTSPLELAPQ
jgi:hypothetical protein